MTVLDLLAQEFDVPATGSTPDRPDDTRALLQPFVTQALQVVAEALEGPNREEMARWVLDRCLATQPTTVQLCFARTPRRPDEVAKSEERERAESFPEESLRRQFGLAACENRIGSSWRDWG